jgi:hypothetical protein
MSDISGSFYVMLNKSQGMVVLTIPPSELLHAENSPSRLHAFEAQVVQWVEETRTLLSQEFPDEDETLTPLDDVTFWRKHRQNMDLLKAQMQFEAVQTLIETVKKWSPAFAEQSAAIEKQVDEQLDLATETEQSLHPLHAFLEQVDTVSEGLDALQEKFEPIFHFLYLMYTRTRWYHSPRHVCGVLRRGTNFVTNQFITTIDGTSMFSVLTQSIRSGASTSRGLRLGVSTISTWVSRRSC